MPRPQRTRQPEDAPSQDAPARGRPPEHPVVALQRTAGNRAAARLIARKASPLYVKETKGKASAEDQEIEFEIEGVGKPKGPKHDQSLKAGAKGLEFGKERKKKVGNVQKTKGTTFKIGEGEVGFGSEETDEQGYFDSEDDVRKGTRNKKERSTGAVFGDAVGVKTDQKKTRERVGKHGTAGFTLGFGGKYTVAVDPEPDSDPPAFRLVTTIALEGSLGGHVKTREGGNLASDAAKGSGSLTATAGRTIVFHRRLTKAEEAAYQKAIKAAATAGGEHWRGAKQSWPELEIIAGAAASGWDTDTMLTLANQVQAGLMGRPSAISGLAEGSGFSWQDDLAAKGDVGASGKGAGVKIGAGVAGKKLVTVMKKDGKVLIGVDVERTDSVSLGATLSLFGAKAGKEGSSELGGGAGGAFAFTPDSGTLTAFLADLSLAGTREDVAELKTRYAKQLKEGTTTVSSKASSTDSFGLFDVIAMTASRGSGRLRSTKTADGETTVTDVGTNDLGMALSVLGVTVASTSTQEKAEFKSKGKSSGGSVTRTRTDFDLMATLEVVRHNALSVWLGATKATKERVNVKGLVLTDDDLGAIQKLASDEKTWHGAVGRWQHLEDWETARKAIKGAGDDHAAVASAISDFLGKDGHGRDEVIKQILRPGSTSLGGGTAFESPAELEGLGDQFQSMVLEDPVQAALAGKEDDPKAALEAIEKALDKQQALVNRLAMSGHADYFENASAHVEMLSRAMAPLLQLRWTKRQLQVVLAGTPEAKAAATAACLDDLRYALIRILTIAKTQEQLVFKQIDEDEGSAKWQRARLNQVSNVYQRMYPALDMAKGLATHHGLGDTTQLDKAFKPDSKGYIERVNRRR